MGTIMSLGCNWWKNNASDRCITGSTPHYIPLLNLFVIDLCKVVLTQNSLKTFVEGIFITCTLNVNNEAASVVKYSSSIDHVEFKRQTA